jgi:hypothetical protein
MKKTPSAAASAGNCLSPDCGKERRLRGLCANHYIYMARLIKAGKATWEEMIAHGKAMPRARNNTFERWALDFKDSKNGKGAQ